MGVPKAVRVLFVCAGNTCRSPMAAAIAANRFGPAVIARSAGIECGSGMAAARNAVAVMSERGLDISSHRSTDVEAMDLTEFDLVVAMGPAVAQKLRKLNPRRLTEWNISDPYGCDMATYRIAAGAIDKAMGSLEL